MNQQRFTMNAFLLVLCIASAFLFLFTLLLPSMADWSATNDFYRIEGTDYAIVYSDRKPNGLYQGFEQTGTLLVEGSFGHDWGIVYEEPYLYANEYVSTKMGIMHCNLVRIDLSTLEKDILLSDAILRGQCSSGELACITDFLMPSTFPQTNSLMRLYAMGAPGVDPSRSNTRIVFLDPETAAAVGFVDSADATGDGFEERYLDRSLQEILAEAS